MSGAEQQRRSRNAALKDYYGCTASGEMTDNELYNLNSPHFNPDMYLHQLIKVCIPTLFACISHVP